MGEGVNLIALDKPFNQILASTKIEHFITEIRLGASVSNFIKT